MTEFLNNQGLHVARVADIGDPHSVEFAGSCEMAQLRKLLIRTRYFVMVGGNFRMTVKGKLVGVCCQRRQSERSQFRTLLKIRVIRDL